jgi:hypothetical protein
MPPHPKHDRIPLVPPSKAQPQTSKPTMPTVVKPIIGVWYQPVSSFPKWKARGINTLVGVELENGGQPGTPAQQAAFVPEGGFDIFAGRVDWAVRVAAGKPVVMFIECSDQNMRVQDYLHSPENQPIGEKRAAAMRAPIPDELEWEVATAMSRGAVGVIYFPQKIGKNWEAFDVTPDDVAARMTAVNLKLAGKTPAPPQLVPAKGPLDGKTLTIDGSSYTLTSK